MIFPSQSKDAIVRGGESVAHATIAANSKAFETLSSRLYADPVAAGVREVGTNAADANRDAGTPDRPFDVHLPTQFEPEFWVRDYGKGLDAEELPRVYMTYFGSTKENDAEATGCLGLGSKSPLAYTDSFLVTSWNGGFRRVYVINKGHGAPEVIKMEETPSDEPTGLKVCMGVRPSDFYRFEERARAVYRYFDPFPRFVGKPLALTRTEFMVPTSQGGLVSQPGFTRIRVVMGNVAYPGDVEQLTTETYVPAGPGGGLTKFRFALPKALQGWEIEFRVPMGAIDIQPSREGVSYGPETIVTLGRAINALHAEVITFLEAEIAAAKTLWEARKLAGRRQSLAAFNAALTWRGRECAPVLQFTSTHKPPVVPEGVTALEKYATRHTRKGNRAYAEPENAHSLDVYSAESNNFAGVLLDDVDPKVRTRTVRHFLDSRCAGKGYCYVIAREAATPEYLALTGLDTVLKKLSDYPPPPRAQRAKKAAVPRVLLREVTNNGFDVETSHPLSDGGFYLETCREKVYQTRETDRGPRRELVAFGYRSDCNDLPNPVRRARALAEFTGEEVRVYGARTADLRKLEKAGNWQELDAYARSALRKEAPALVRKAELQAALAALDVPCGKVFRGLLDARRDEDSPFGLYSRLLAEAGEAARDKRVAQYADLAAYYRQDHEVAPAKDLLDAAKEALRLYPLFFQLDSSWKVSAGEVARNLEIYLDAVNAKLPRKRKPRARNRPSPRLLSVAG